MSFFDAKGKGDWVQLNTLVWVRWSAILGQIVAVVASLLWLDLDLPLGAISVAIGALIVLNLFMHSVFPRTAPLSNERAWSFLVLDIAQLGGLLMLTGGLSNPFTLLILAPVAIGATVLPLRGALFAAGLALTIVSLMAFFYLPLRDNSGGVLELPSLFRFGVWLALGIGIVFVGAYARRVATEIYTMSDALVATQLALAREQKLTDLGGVIAATAHELGTPLATIKLASAELCELLAETPDLQADAQLIRDQADRCKSILSEMGRAGNQDQMLRHLPIQALVEEAAAPHTDRGRAVVIKASAVQETQIRHPSVPRRPEILHGLRNLVQNAVDFSANTVVIAITWSDEELIIRIRDDGPGYPTHLLGRLGDPMMMRRTDSPKREGYDGMGLGLFIAKTLLGRTGATLSFANGSGARRGAIAQVRWPMDRLTQDPQADRRALGKNFALKG